MTNPDAQDPLRAILFDFDGTLIDASAAICHSFNHALKFVGLAPLSAEVIRLGIGRPLREIFLEYAPPERLEEVVGAYREEFSRLSLAESRLIHGVEALIPRLARDHLLGIVTSRTSGGVHLLMKHFGLERYFRSVVGVQEVRNCKPAPEPILVALSELGVEPTAAAMLGDTIHDMESACAAGVLPVGVATGSHSKADLLRAGAVCVLDSVVDLPEFLASRE